MPIESLDMKDKRILTELSLNARAQISTIAKKVGLSKQVVKYRLENLEKKGIIEGYYAILNVNKLGYEYHRLFLKLTNTNPEVEEQMIKFCQLHKKVAWVFQSDGDVDLGILVLAKDSAEFELFFDEMLNQFGEYLNEKQVSVTTKIHHYRYKFLLEKKDPYELIMGGKVEAINLDENDFKILAYLSKTARKPLLEMEKDLKLHHKLIAYRIKKMQDSGVILGYRTKINHEAMGYTHYKINLFLSNISRAEMNRLMTYIKNLTASIYITKAMGMADIEFEILVKNHWDFHKIMRNMKYEFSKSLRTFTTYVIYNEPLISYFPLG